jgi:uncharacterized delta-60 repeat protein
VSGWNRRSRGLQGYELFALLLIGMFVALAASAISATAEPMRLDPSFGSSGRVNVTTAPEPEDLRIAEARDGDLLVVAGQTLTAHFPSGPIDRRFGENGSVPLVSSPDTRLRVGDLAVDAQGRPVVFGTLENIGDFAMLESYMGGTIDSSVATVLRFTPAGAPDPTFGSSGVVRTDLGLPYAEQSGKPVATAAVGFVDSLDRPVFAGGRVREVGCGHGRAVRQDEMVVRLAPNGAPDASFGGGDGIEPVAGIATISGLVTGHDGETIVAASTPSTCEDGGDGRIIDLRPDGLPEVEFASAGSRDLPGMSTTSVTVDHRGRILVMGQRGETSFTPVLRLEASGKLDRGFGRTGEAKIRLGSLDQIGLLATDRHNRVILGGTLGPNPAKSSHGRLMAIRLTVSGHLDRSFANAGRVATAFGAASQPRARGMLIDRRGRLVLAGLNWNSRTEESGYGLARYREGN